MINKEKIKKIEKKIIRQGQWKEIDTGVRRVTTLIEDDVERKEERPVYERVFVPPQFEDIEVSYDVWVVERNGERHEFANEDDAKRFEGSK